MNRLASTAGCVLLLWNALEGQAGADDAKARNGVAQAHIALGVKLYEQGALDEAIAELELARRIDEDATVCYALGQAYRRKQDCATAIRFYRCAVQKATSESVERAANYQIGRCVVSEPGPSTATPPVAPLATPPSAPTAPASSSLSPAPTAAPVVAPAPPPVVRSSPRRWYRDVPGGVLGGLGLAAMAAGAGVLGYAEVRATRATDDLASYEAAHDVRTDRIVGGVVLAAGGLLVVGGVIRYARVHAAITRSSP